MKDVAYFPANRTAELLVLQRILTDLELLLQRTLGIGFLDQESSCLPEEGPKHCSPWAFSVPVVFSILHCQEGFLIPSQMLFLFCGWFCALLFSSKHIKLYIR